MVIFSNFPEQQYCLISRHQDSTRSILEFDSVPGQNATFTLNPEWTGPKPAFDKVVLSEITEVKAAELAFEALPQSILQCVSLALFPCPH